MTLSDFNRAVSLFRDGKITAYLQGGLSVTGTWFFLTPANPIVPPGTRSIVLIDANGTRTVAPINTITALREVPELTSKRA